MNDGIQCIGNTAYIDRLCMVCISGIERDIWTNISKSTWQHSTIRTHRKKVCVVGNTQFLETNSVVVTLVHVIHNETTCPASKDSTNRFVQTLFMR